MPNSPIIWGPNGALNLEAGGMQMQTGQFLANDGAKNYLLNPVIETGVTSPGYSLGTATLTSNLPTGVPTFGSGAAGTLSLTALTTSAIAGTYSLNYVSSAATTAGNFVATDAFTIDTSDQAKVLTFSFYYSTTVGSATNNYSGTTSNSFGVAIYDVTNSAWVIPAGIFGMTQGTGVGFCTGTFQTASNGSVYRLAIYNANASGAATTVLFDRFFCGPQTAPLGAVATDWASYSLVIGGSTSAPTQGAGATNNAFWRRVGDSVSIEFIYFQSSAGTAGSGQYLFPLPAGLSIDTTKIALGSGAGSASAGNISSVGSGNVTNASNQAALIVGIYNSTNLCLFPVGNTAGTMTQVSSANYALSTTLQSMTFTATVPVVGWSSNVQTSSSTDTRVISFNGTQTSQSITGTSTDIAFTANLDRAGAWNGTQFVVPVAGDYLASSTHINSATNQAPIVYKNGSLLQYGTFVASSAEAANVTVFVPNCKPGDTISFRNTATGTISASSASVFRLSGPAVITATESVNARYHSATATITGTASAATYTTKDFDTHNAYSGSTYTIPVTGKYQVNAAIVIAATFAVTNLSALYIFKNGSSYSQTSVYAGGIQGDAGLEISDIVQCNAGDTIVIEVSSAGSVPTVLASTTANYFSISRVGN